MGTMLVLRCGGCDAQIEIGPIRKTFQSFTGNRSVGFGRWQQPSIDDLVDQTGWTWSDPYTACTYCPKCMAEIENSSAA